MKILYFTGGPARVNTYFVFDDNIRQTSLLRPASAQQRNNWELSNYEPSLRSDYEKPVVEPYQQKPEPKSEYDIIQKILKDDTFIEVMPDEFENIEETKNTEEQPRQQTIIKQKEENEQETPTKQMDATILSSVEIAPSRGFMCVSYNNNINLVGYIFDDVFALYNFKQPKLENYNIKFRLSEKTSNGANFIVKVDKAKMLVSVTKSSMNMEVAM